MEEGIRRGKLQPAPVPPAPIPLPAVNHYRDYGGYVAFYGGVIGYFSGVLTAKIIFGVKVLAVIILPFAGLCTIAGALIGFGLYKLYEGISYLISSISDRYNRLQPVENIQPAPDFKLETKVTERLLTPQPTHKPTHPPEQQNDGSVIPQVQGIQVQFSPNRSPLVANAFLPPENLSKAHSPAEPLRLPSP